MPYKDPEKERYAELDITFLTRIPQVTDPSDAVFV